MERLYQVLDYCTPDESEAEDFEREMVLTSVSH